MPILYAEIQLAGLQAACAAASFSFAQTTDDRGRPSSTVRTGFMKVLLTGEAAGWSIWEEIKFDSYRRNSGHLIFFQGVGQTAKRYTFYNAALVHYECRFDARGRDGQSSLEVELHFSAATVDVQGQRIESYSTIPWATDAETSFRALTKPVDLLPSPQLRAQPSQEAPPEAADFMRFDKEKKPLSERPQSKKTGYLGSPKLSKPQLIALAKVAEERYGAPVQVIKANEMALITNNPDVRAMFRTELDPTTGQRTGTIYVQKGVTDYELTHELMHAKQFHQLGYEAYWVKQTKLQREEFVFNELTKNKNQWSEAEVTHAADYIEFVRYGKWPNR